MPRGAGGLTPNGRSRRSSNVPVCAEQDRATPKTKQAGAPWWRKCHCGCSAGMVRNLSSGTRTARTGKMHPSHLPFPPQLVPCNSSPAMHLVWFASLSAGLVFKCRVVVLPIPWHMQRPFRQERRAVTFWTHGLDNFPIFFLVQDAEIFRKPRLLQVVDLSLDAPCLLHQHHWHP